jgi:putative transposase
VECREATQAIIHEVNNAQRAWFNSVSRFGGTVRTSGATVRCGRRLETEFRATPEFRAIPEFELLLNFALLFLALAASENYPALMSPQFTAFNNRAPVGIYYRNLPHWHQDGATCFITFRLADSIPRALVEQWNEERQLWLEARGITESLSRIEREKTYAKIDPQQRRNFERQNARRLFSELDRCHGCCLFKNPVARNILRESMLHNNGIHYHSGDFVIMPNHVHWIIQPLEESRLWKSMRAIKRFSATQLTRSGLHEGKLWQKKPTTISSATAPN